MNSLSERTDSGLKIGRLVTLVVGKEDELVDGSGPESSDGLEARVYRTRIENLLPESLVVSWPTDQGIRLLASVGQGVTVQIASPQGVVCLHSRITSLSTKPIPVLHVCRQGNWSLSQLRANVRLEVTIALSAAEVLPISMEDLASGNGLNGASDLGALRKWPSNSKLEGEPFRAMICDLSAGGVLLIVSSVHLVTGSIMRVRFSLGKDQPELSTLATVVRVIDGEPGNKEYPFKAGCRFLDLSTKDEDIITKFIFAKQAELRRSGML